MPNDFSNGFDSIRAFAAAAAGPEGVPESVIPQESHEVDVDSEEEGEFTSFDGADTSSDSSKPADQVSKDPAAEVQAKANADIEEILVKGLDGKKSKIKVDYSNREAIKDAFKKAQGMRLAFKERDDLSRKLKAYEAGEQVPEAHKADLEAYKVISKAFSEGGVESLIELLNKNNGGYKGWKESKEAYEKMLPSEKAELESRKEIEKANRRAEEAERSAKERTESLVKQQEASDKARLKSMLTPAFHKHSLSKELDDAEAGARIDQAIWRDSIKEISNLQLPEGAEPTPAMVERIFSKVAASYRKVIAVKADKKVAETINRKKEDATNALVQTAKAGIGVGNSAASVREQISKGKLRDVLFSHFSNK